MVFKIFYCLSSDKSNVAYFIANVLFFVGFKMDFLVFSFFLLENFELLLVGFGVL